MTQNNLTEEALKAVFDKLSMKAEADTVRLKGEVNDLVENMLRDEISRQYDSGQKERGAFDPMDFYRPSALGKTLSDGMCLWPCVTEHPEKGTSTGFEMMINHSNLLHVAYANMLKHRLPMLKVAKGDIVKLHVAFDIVESDGIWLIFDIILSIQNFKDAVCAGRCLGHQGNYHAQLPHRDKYED